MSAGFQSVVATRDCDEKKIMSASFDSVVATRDCDEKKIMSAGFETEEMTKGLLQLAIAIKKHLGSQSDKLRLIWS
jgi:hypothetical protein